MNVGQRLQRRFRKALREYRLIEDGDKILVGLSGGKDSLCLLELLARQSKVFFPKFTVEALHVRMENIQYESDTSYLQSFCDSLDVPLHIITTHFDTQKEEQKTKPACFLCSWQRRKQLFNVAQELGCNKIALGHHQDDIIHTALMNLTFQGTFSSMPPVLRMDKMPLSIIRPLCLCEEADIIEYAEQQKYKKQLKLCPYERETNRTSIHGLFGEMQHLNSDARHSIWNAIETTFKRSVALFILMAMTTAVSFAQNHTPTEQSSKQTERLKEMTKATQQIMFIDSIVIPKKNFLKAYHLSPEAGRIAPYSAFFPKQKSMSLTFMNALDNYCVYSKTNHDGEASLFYQEYLQNQWTTAEQVLGVNEELQFQKVNYPFMMPDGMTLYFSAQGEGCIGGYDIFMTTYDASEGRFLKPENIGMPFNSTANDYLFVIDEYNNLGFFATDRNQPDNMVCVYTFIPAEKYHTYDANQYRQEEITAFANIAEISRTWVDNHALKEARKRLKQIKKSPAKATPAFSFVINAYLTYHQLSDFKADGNLERYRELTKQLQHYEQIVKSLEKSRNYYPKATKEERYDLTKDILEKEQTQHQLYLSIHQIEKAIRQAENTYLIKTK